jgi:hypothetical protein
MKKNELKDITEITPEYDVAISFLSSDQLLAAELAGRLQESLKVFFFPKAQTQLAGTDGLESMRAPFATGSLVNVILFRAEWGNTDWTRLEESAIKDGCLRRGWNTLFFVQLENNPSLPRWLPDTHVRYSLGLYGIDGLVGAIKARVQEQGGRIVKAGASAHANRVRLEAELIADKAKFFRDRPWIESNVYPSISQALLLAVEIVTREGALMSPQIRAGMAELVRKGNFSCVMSDDRVSVAAGWVQPIYNDIQRGSHIAIRNFRGAVALPGERKMCVFGPELVTERLFVPDLTASREVAWVEQGKTRQLSADDLGNEIASACFDLVSKVSRGEIELPFT